MKLMTLYHNYLSSASYRVRIALNHKNLPCNLIAVDLSQRQQLSAEFRKHNKHGRVPTLEHDGMEIGQSSAILEYLEERYPTPPLLPSDIKSRAYVRYLSQIVISDMHPVMNNSSVVRYLRTDLHATEEQVNDWYHTWLKQGFDALEANLSDKPQRRFCFDDYPTFADLCLIPQIFNAHRFKFSMEKYPTLMGIYQHCNSLSAFEKAHPENHKAENANSPFSASASDQASASTTRLYRKS